MPPNGCGIWNERAIPIAQRRGGGAHVISTPSSSTRPASAATVPVMMPNSVVLPAPFGPMIPSASPCASARSSPSAMTMAPKRLEIFSRARMDGMTIEQTRCRPREGGDPYFAASPLFEISATSLGHGVWVPAFAGATASNAQHYDSSSNLPPTGMLFAVPFWVMTSSNALPLARDERRLGDVLDRPAGPAHRPDDRTVVGRRDRIEDRFWIAEIPRALEHVDRDLEQRMLEADRLGPRPLRRPRIGVSQFARALAGEPRLERMVRRPPDLGGEPVAAGAERIDDRGAEERLADGAGLGPVS